MRHVNTLEGVVSYLEAVLELDDPALLKATVEDIVRKFDPLWRRQPLAHSYDIPLVSNCERDASC